jgi:photosystem II stability/assembly factor-like uncharacterized protein
MNGFQGDYLDGVEAQLRALTERGAHRSWRSRLHAASNGRRDGRSGSRIGLGVLALAGPTVAAVVIAAIVLTTLHVAGGPPSRASQPARPAAAGSRPANSGGKPARGPSRGGSGAGARAGSRRHRSQRAAAPAAAGTAPSGFQPESFTAISEFTWWLLGNAPCSSPPCTSIVHTVNGGQSFVGLPAPRTTEVDELRFADPFDGFAYGPELWVTHDGSASWHRVDVGGSVTDMAFADGFAYAIVRNRVGVGRLLRAPVDTDDWVVLGPAGNAFSGLWAHGSDVLLESQRSNGRSKLMLSHDEGASFTASTPPPNVACDFEEQLAGVIWAHCATGMLSGVWRSTDYGRRFQTAVGAGRARLPEQPNSAAFASASSSTAVVGYQQLYRTTDGGARYARVSGPRGVTWWQYLGFTDATHGVALGSFGSGARERLYYTINAGASYHYVPIP